MATWEICQLNQPPTLLEIEDEDRNLAEEFDSLLEEAKAARKRWWQFWKRHEPVYWAPTDESSIHVDTVMRIAWIPPKKRREPKRTIGFLGEAS